jgi:hypothetical protein
MSSNHPFKHLANGPTRLRPFGNTVPINLDQALQIKELLVEDETHSKCRDILIRALFLFGLQAKTSLPKMKVGEAFSYFTNKELNSFAIHAFIDSVTQGFTVFNFVSVERQTPEGVRKILTPNNVPLINLEIEKTVKEDYSVKTTIRKSLHLTETRDLKPDGDADIYYYEWDRPPSVYTGNLTSTLSPFLHVHESFSTKRRFHDMAVMQSSHPPVIIQQAPNTALSAAERVTVGGSGESVLAVFGEEADHRANVQKIVEVHEAKYMNHAEIPDDSFMKLELPDGPNKRQRFYPTPVDNLFPLNNGYVVSPAITPATPQSDFLDFQKHKDLQIASAWGIPPSIANLDKGKSATGANAIVDNDLEVFAKTVQYYQKQIVDFVTYVYAIYLPLVSNDTTSDGISFELPIIPWVSTRALYELYNQNIISFDTLQRHAAKINGLRDEDIATEPNEITRPPPNGSENVTTAIMRAKVEVMMAEAEERREKAKLAKDERLHGPADEAEVSKDMQDAELKMADKELELMDKKLIAMDKQIKLQEKKNQQPIAPASAHR